MRSEIKNLLIRIIKGAYDTLWLEEKAGPFVKEIRDGKTPEIRTELKQGELLAVSSRARDLFFEQILDEGEYTGLHPLVILNPYGIAPLSAIALCTTSKPASVIWRICGKNGGKDLVLETKEKKTRHRIPIVGLYANKYNRIHIEFLFEDGSTQEKKLWIKTGRTLKSLRNCIKIRKHIKETSREYLYVSGGFSQNSYIFDSKGQIRFYLNKKVKAYGTHMLSQGHFLFTEPDIAKPTFSNPHVTIFHEMDFMGRVYRTYQVGKGIHHFVTEKEPGGNLFALGSTLAPKLGMENAIMEIDRVTGRIVSELDLNRLFDETYRNRHDWAHINSIRYLPKENSVLVSLRNLHSIAKICWDTKELEWILGETEFWKATSMMDKVLKPIGEVKWFYQQHTAELIAEDGAKKEILVFDNHVAVRRKAPLFQPDPHSYLSVFLIDEEKKTVTMGRQFQMDNSEIRSNGVLVRDAGRIFGMAGCLRPKLEGFGGMVYEFDYEQGDLVNEYGLKNDFFTGYPIRFEPQDMSKPLDMGEAYKVGKLKQPVEIKMEEQSLTAAKAGNQNSDFPAYMMDDIFLVRQSDHEIKKIYAIGKNYQYVLDETDTWQKTKKFANAVYHISFPFGNVKPDCYRVYVETEHGIQAMPERIECVFP